MAEVTIAQKREHGRLKRWLLEGHIKEMEGSHERDSSSGTILNTIN